MTAVTATPAIEIIVIFAIVLAVMIPLRRIAWRVGLVDRPGERHQHDAATPAVGGWAILLALAAAYILLVKPSAEMLGIGLAALIVVVAGSIDDVHRLSWRWVLASQVLAALVLIEVGGIRVRHLGGVFGVPDLWLWHGSSIMTIIATVGIINAVNMIDGVDGLAGSVGLAATAMLAAVAAYAGNNLLSRDLVFVAAALAGFLIYNLRSPWNARAAIFLGNAGSQLLGLVIAVAAFRLTQNGQHPVGPQLAPFLLAPALFDCLTLIIRRLRVGASPFKGDRNHLHHLMLDAGFSVTSIVAILTGATLLIGAMALVAMKAHVRGFYYTIAFVGMWVAYFLATRRRGRSVAGLAWLTARLRLSSLPNAIAPAGEVATSRSILKPDGRAATSRPDKGLRSD
jgi:UDP-GlcNAc:undecaprenyl-phosphate GlcNAc-1-phosphate transferase